MYSQFSNRVQWFMGNDDVRCNNRFLALSNQTLISIHVLVQLTLLIDALIN